MLALSEVAGLLGKLFAPLLPPWGTGLATAAHQSRSDLRIPAEVRQQLRYGRGLDNRKLKQAGYRFEPHDARDGAGVRRGAAPRDRCERARDAPYRYEREVEEFLRWSPSVRRDESGS